MKSKTAQNQYYMQKQQENGRNAVLIGELPFPEKRFVYRCPSVLAIEGNRVYLKTNHTDYLS